MATLSNNVLDLLDIWKRQDKKGNILPVIEMLMKDNPVLEDAMLMECNQGFEHMHAVRTGLPSLAWGLLYKGIPQGKSNTAQVKDTTGFVEGLSSVDTRLLRYGNAAAIRDSEAQPFYEAMRQEIASKMFYGNTATAPEQFMGLAPRFNDPTAKNGSQLIDGGGTGSDNTSIWMVAWGDRAVTGLYPQGHVGGVQREDKGEHRIEDADGNAYYVKEEYFVWHMGLAVTDWRYVVRIPNIDVSELAAGNVDVYGLLRSAYYKFEGRKRPGGKNVIYCNAEVKEAMDSLASNAGSSDNFIRLVPKELQGKEIDTWRGIPVREVDAILNNETAVTGF